VAYRGSRWHSWVLCGRNTKESQRVILGATMTGVRKLHNKEGRMISKVMTDSEKCTLQSQQEKTRGPLLKLRKNHEAAHYRSGSSCLRRPRKGRASGGTETFNSSVFLSYPRHHPRERQVSINKNNYPKSLNFNEGNCLNSSSNKGLS
jgi:hypothetical protein